MMTRLMGRDFAETTRPNAYSESQIVVRTKSESSLVATTRLKAVLQTSECRTSECRTSECCVAAVDHQVGSGYERGFVRSKKQNGISHFAGLTYPAQYVFGTLLRQEFPEGHARLLHMVM